MSAVGHHTKVQWTSVPPTPNELHKSSKQFSIVFEPIQYYDSGLYVCKEDASGKQHNHELIVVSQPEAGYASSARYMFSHDITKELAARLVHLVNGTLCIDEMIINGKCLYQVKDTREEVYRWKILITWQISAPELDHYVTVVKRCHHNHSCVADARYGTAKLAVTPSLDKVIKAESTAKIPRVNMKLSVDSKYREKLLKEKGKSYLHAVCAPGTRLKHGGVMCVPCKPNYFLTTKPGESTPTKCERCQLDKPLPFSGLYGCLVMPTGPPSVRPGPPTTTTPFSVLGISHEHIRAEWKVMTRFRQLAILAAVTLVLVALCCASIVLLQQGGEGHEQYLKSEQTKLFEASMKMAGVLSDEALGPGGGRMGRGGVPGGAGRGRGGVGRGRGAPTAPAGQERGKPGMLGMSGMPGINGMPKPGSREILTDKESSHKSKKKKKKKKRDRSKDR